jgi:hypothetical protein
MRQTVRPLRSAGRKSIIRTFTNSSQNILLLETTRIIAGLQITTAARKMLGLERGEVKILEYYIMKNLLSLPFIK